MVSSSSDHGGLRVEPLSNEQEWEDFVQHSPKGTFFHTLKWKEILRHHFPLEPAYLVVRETSGAVVGVCPFVIRHELGVFSVLESLPHSDYAGPLVTEGYASSIMKALTTHLAEMARSKHVTYAKVRFSDNDLSRLFGAGKSRVDTSAGTMVVDLEQTPPDVVWNNALNSSRRRQIRLMERDGFQVKTCESIDDLNSFYVLYRGAMEYIGAYHFPHAFLLDAFDTLYPDNFNVFLMAKDNRVFAGMAFYVYKPAKTVYQTLIGIDRTGKYPGLPYIYMSWHFIKWAEALGYRYVSLGATPSNPNETGYGLKSRLGAEFVQDYFLYYPFNRPLFLAREIAEKLWRHTGSRLPRGIASRLLNLAQSR